MRESAKTKWYLSDVIKSIDEKISRNLDRVGVMLQAKIVQSFGAAGVPGSGGTKGREHSAPGEPPFVQTGTLRRSITFQREGTTKLLVGSTLKPQNGNEHSYAWYLEMGSPQGQLAARPFLRPAVRKNKDLIARMLKGKE